VLARCRRGLLAEPTEAAWIERRLAELLTWPWVDSAPSDGAR
jgi:hypothetical protein